MAKLIDGKAVSEKLIAELRKTSAELEKQGHGPGLAVILVGEDPASKVYVRNKHRACEKAGIYSEQYHLPAETDEGEIIGLIEVLNGNSKISGILVQLPLPAGLDERKVLSHIAPEKDADAITAANVGAVMQGEFLMSPCTPGGIMELLEEYDIPIEGKECVVVGRSDIVGKPMAMLLLHKNATVTIAHSKTKNLAEVTRRADILVSAVGRAGFITAEMVKDGAVVIDVGMNRNEQGKLCGDVCFDEVEKKASFITPVPGGVGPMTIATLLKNTVNAAKNMG